MRVTYLRRIRRLSGSPLNAWLANYH